MKINLVTAIGLYVKQLPFMLNHYRKLGVDSFEINVNIRSREDPVLSEVGQYIREFGCGISSITVGEWSEGLNLKIYNQSRADRPNDWFILADVDELQVYPDDLRSILEECERHGYDYIEGCFIDRIAADGGFPELSRDIAIEKQFPLGCMFTYRVLGGAPLKVVAARGQVKVSAGNHFAINGHGCPIDRHFAQVHHYKWMGGLVDRMMSRMHNIGAGEQYSSECQRFVEYYYANQGRIDISDPRLWVSECKTGYRFWNQVRERVKVLKSLHLRE